MFGSPETQPGGRALKFYSSQRLDIRRIETLKEGTEAVGNRVRVKVVKNKVAAPFRQAEFDIEFGKGISTAGCLIDLGIEHNVVTKSGSFFSYGDERLGQGRNNAKAFLNEHPEIAKEIEAKIYAALGIDRDAVVPPIERRRRRRSTSPLSPSDVAEDRRGDDLGLVTSQARLERPARRRLQHALDLAYRYLGRRDRTVAEVRRHLEAKRVEPEHDRATPSPSSASRATSTTRASPSVHRGPAQARRVGRRPHRAQAAQARRRARADRGGARGRVGGAELDAAVALLRAPLSGRAPADDRERERALGLLVRKGYELELAYDAVRAFERADGGLTARGPARPVTRIRRKRDDPDPRGRGPSRPHRWNRPAASASTLA